MKITFLGQAGLFVETRAGSILCDPWFNPAYFASWFPFPSNEGIDRAAIGHPDFLYISHLHHDHFDPEFLKDHVDKSATVLLPDFPVDRLERELRSLGFSSFVKTRNGETVETNGLRFTIVALTAPSDGPIGDSSLIVDDGETRLLDQNDAHPLDVDALQAMRPFHAHFLQFSGAIWYPMVYRLPQKAKDALAKKKRENQQARALRYAEAVGAPHVFPSAGPPCFLDDDLLYLNDVDNVPTNIFCDQTVFLRYLRDHGNERGHLVVPGSVIELQGGQCSLAHPLPDAEIEAIFADKRGYLEAYHARQRPRIQAIKETWPRGQVEILPALKDWFEPLLRMADLTCAGVNSRVLLDCSGEQIAIDFVHRQVYRWNDEECRYRFWIDRALVEACIVAHEEDWVNSIFLSCRFEAERVGAYNEYVYNFFKCLTPERLQYAEGYYAERSPVHELWQCGAYMVQRRCPHLKADLTRFAEVQNGILTCTMHGWQFEIATGRCLTSDDRRLYTTPAPERPSVAAESEKAPVG
ncbi:MAG TPA: Rieske 2Fe-2S domain-containing protein [Chloroflexota bacterium]|nr:Rieske 2Fe-2S domain-containing protein [Chloroflexota bacterium]